MYKEDRDKVQTLLDKNLVVEAGAGTGKTSLLIMRLCVAVLVQGSPVEKLVALTFTEKAAAEIKTRFIAQLHEVAQALQTGEKTPLITLLTEHFQIAKDVLASRAEAALARLDHAHMGTIHGFCADILKTFPLEAGLSPSVEIDAGQRARHLFEARWNTFLDQELGTNPLHGESWKQVLPRISLPDLKLFAQELCSGKIAHYDYFSHREMIISLCEEKAAQATRWSTAFLEDAKKQPRNSEKALAWAAQSMLRTVAFLRGEQVPPLLQEEPPAFPAVVSKGWEADLFEEARGLVAFAQKLTPENQQLFLQALQLVLPLTEQVRQDYAREGILSFDDLIVKTRDLLQRDFYVRRLLKEKFDRLFIDEFQDTDPVQGELLLFLAEEKLSSASRWQEIRLEPGKLFVVGDPKQSIYRFRGADITAYELFTALILKQGGEKCFLQKNFRSAPEIVSVANEVCQRAMVQQTAFQPAYVPILPTKKVQPDAVEWLFIEPPSEDPLADDYRHNQAEQIARWIEKNVGKLTLADGRKLSYGDIALLSRAATTAGPYTDALRRHGIAFNVEVDKDFYHKQEINDFLNFLRVVADPTDRTALVGVLRSPWGGFTDEEIYQIVLRKELDLKAPTADPALARCYQQISHFVQKAGRTPIKQLLHDVLEQTFLPEACMAAYEGEQTLASLQRLLRMTEEFTEGMSGSLSQFLASVQQIITEEPERLGASAVDNTKNAVSVMTVHKSKGLGFPVVILADLSKREAVSAAKPQNHVFSWQYNMHGLRAGKICDANLAFLEEEQKKHHRCEEVRILYVALTRAKEKMLLVADGRKGAEKAAAAFASVGLFPQGKEAVVTAGETSIPVHSFPYNEPENFLYLRTLPSVPTLPQNVLTSWKEKAEKRRSHYEALLEATPKAPSEQVQAGITFSASQRRGAEVGTVCHEALRLLLTQKELDGAQAIHQAALNTGLEDREAEGRQILEPFIVSPLFEQIKANSVLACEMPFSLAQEGGIQSGVMDAVLLQADGKVWVIDYKTDIIPPTGTRALLEKYRPQLTVYQRAARQIFPGRQVRTSAVFVRAFAVEDL